MRWITTLGSVLVVFLTGSFVQAFERVSPEKARELHETTTERRYPGGRDESDLKVRKRHPQYKKKYRRREVRKKVLKKLRKEKQSSESADASSHSG